MTRPFETLSRFQRRATPLPFARYLVERVRTKFDVSVVAVLWVENKSHYWKLWPGVELWGIGRDARNYNGPHPVICHPPCGPWGKYKSNCFHSKQDGIIAMDIAHRWGGIVEHPLGSSLFADHGRIDAAIERINQGDFGHKSLKPTLLYFADRTEFLDPLLCR